MKKKISTLASTLIILFSALAISHGASGNNAIIIKYATLAPAGSLWGIYIRKMQRDIEKQTNGRVQFKPYLGGVIGNEKSIGRKLRAGSIQMASFSGQGLGEILSDIRVLELPMLFDNYSQVDKAVKAATPDLTASLDKLGYVFAGWGEGGFVYLLSKNPIASAQDMDGKRIWAPTGDEIVKSLFVKYGLVPTYVGIESVLPQLQTGGLDAIYGPPIAAIAMQWFREVKYMTDVKLAYSVGGTLINKRYFETWPADVQKIVMDVFIKYSRELVLDLRKQNDRAVTTLKQSGIEIIEMKSKDKAFLQNSAEKVHDELAGKLYPKSLLKKVKDSI